MPINVLMPALSPTMTEGNLAKWLKKEGDKVSSGDVLAEIETDKATMEVEAVDEGILGKIIVPAGTEGVAVNAVIALILSDSEDKSALDTAVQGASAKVSNSNVAAPTASNVSASATPPAAPAVSITATGSGRVLASPLAKRLAVLQGLDIASVKGSGPNGRILKADIESAKTAGVSKAAAPTAAAKPAVTTSNNNEAKILADQLSIPYTEIPNSGMRKVIASRLSQSKQTVPHFYLSVDCQLDELLEIRKKVNDSNPALKISVNDFVIKASALALRDVPQANASWTDSAILQYTRADVSVAVATPTGLITPIIKDAANKSLKAISSEMKDLAVRARDGKLKPTEFQGGTFSISNLGMFGIDSFQAIVNPPQGCILAVGAGVKKAVVKDDKLAIATVMNATLSCDHRVVDGAVGAEFLKALRGYLENPMSILV